MDSDPNKSFAFAQQAAVLGDPSSDKLKSELLDYKGADHSAQMGQARVQTISQLISKLDPVYSFNSLRSEELRKIGFMTFLSGKFHFIQIFNLAHLSKT